MAKSIYVLLMITAFSACNSSNKTADVSETFLIGNNWFLKKIYSDSGTVDVKNDIANLKFDAEKKSAGGKGGCNNYGTKYTVNNDQINFKDLFSTKMFCENSQSIENKFFRALEEVNRYEAREGQLLLYKNDSLLLEFGK